MLCVVFNGFNGFNGVIMPIISIFNYSFPTVHIFFNFYIIFQKIEMVFVLKTNHTHQAKQSKAKQSKSEQTVKQKQIRSEQTVKKSKQ